MRKLLTIAPYASSRPVSGGTRRIHFLNRGIADAGWDVFQFSAAGMGKTGPFRSKEFRHSDSYVEYRYINPAFVLVNRGLKELGAPQIAPSFLPRIAYPALVLRRELARRDIVMFEHPHYYDFARPLLRSDQRVVLDAHNVEFAFHNKDFEAGGIRGRAARRLFEMERDLFRRADLAFTCTAEDRDKAVELFGADPSRIQVAPNGTDVGGTAVASPAERESAKAKLGLDRRAVAIFAGSNWPPNVEAALSIVEMARAAPAIAFIIVGSVANALPDDLPVNISAPGFVDDLNGYFAAGDVALNPMQSGGGSNVKLFDYLAAGLPVISTAFGARGVDVADDGAVERVELADFPRAIAEIAESSDLARRQAAARKLAEREYDWRVISARVADALAGLAGAAGGGDG